MKFRSGEIVIFNFPKTVNPKYLAINGTKGRIIKFSYKNFAGLVWRIYSFWLKEPVDTLESFLIHTNSDWNSEQL